MTPQEQQLLTSLTQRINQTQLQEKDPDAENLLGRELGANPDAIYILAQTVLVQNIALDQAKAQVAQLQQQVQQAHQPAHATSFLGRLLGDRDPEPPHPQQPPFQPVPPQYAQPQYAPPQYQPVPYQQVPYQQPQYVPMQAGGQPSFLRGAMQTAAGVAAGALAFEGVESILHGFGNPGMGMGGYGMMGGGFERPVEENVVNNYYGDGEGPHAHEPADRLSGQDNINDSGNNLSGFDDSNVNNSGTDDASGFDSANQDDTAAGFDDGGQDDSGGGFDDGGGGGGFGDDSGGGDLS